MGDPDETAAAVALLRNARGQATPLDGTASALERLESEHGLLAQQLLEQAAREVERWRGQGIRALTPAHPDYPKNLRAVSGRPPLIFVSGRLERRDVRSVAVLGTRQASPAGLDAATTISQHLAEEGFTVVSGLALGIDSAVHRAVLAAQGRTLAVIGTGVRRCYPPQNRDLQERIGREGAVISRFWPDSPPTRRSFPLRNVLMAGISLASVIVEAGPTSGCRIEARSALAQGRPVILLEPLLEHAWARELAQRPGVHVLGTPVEVVALVNRLTEESLAA